MRRSKNPMPKARWIAACAAVVGGLVLLHPLVLAQGGGNPPQGPGQGQGQGQGQGGTNPQQPPRREDPIKKVREDITGTKKTNQFRPIVLQPLPPVQAETGKLVSFQIIVRDRAEDPVPLIYSLEGAPTDAEMDPVTGIFRWFPLSSGNYRFNVVVKDNSVPPRMATQQITIRVTDPLTFFGYSFFQIPRAAIEARILMARQMMMPLQPPVAGVNGVPMQDFQRQQNQNQNNQGNGNQGNQNNQGQGNNQGNNQGNQGSGGNQNQGNQNQGNQNQGNQNQGNQNQGNQNQGNQGNQQNQNQGFPPDNRPPLPGQPGFQGQPVNGGNTLDARQFPVGPFEMMGNNVFVPSPERYQLGPGDTLTIRYWSPTEEPRDIDVRIDPAGRINLPVTGENIVLRGQTLVQAEALLRRALARTLRDASLTVSLRELRTMSIVVLGEAYMAGSYQVPAVVTLFNALYMFGGPTMNGSLRRIELRRTDGTRRTFDLYQFLVFGDASQDVPLQPGDVIYIPPVDSRVTVKG
ncbi:MAG TPA: polysaccharide biosynthesis/export family protein, partial [Fimbriimonadaceae bacterium]|nr:polysaccharide biosynthesis/export family protein [Fimbriimonadaceae bacterium]